MSNDEDFLNLYKTIRNFMWTYIGMPVICFGIVGNIVSILVLLRPRMRAMQVSVYLITLVSNDLVILLSDAIPRVTYIMAGINILSEHAFLCKFLPYLSQTSLLYAVWLTVLISSERMICVSFPIWSSINLKIKLKIIAMVTLFILVSCVTAVNLFWKKMIFFPTLNTTRCIMYRPSDDVAIYELTYSVVYSFIPAILLLVCSFVIAFKLRNRLLVKDSQQKKANQSQASNNAIRILVFINLVYFLIVLPYGIMIFILRLIPANRALMIALGITDVLFYISNSINFLLYSASGPTFRKELRNCCCGKKSLTERSQSKGISSVSETVSRKRKLNDNVQISSLTSVREFDQISDRHNI